MSLNNAFTGLLSHQRVFVILGPYGSGKTEIAINLAGMLARDGRRAALADLDIVNPYFRSREKEDILKAAGIRLIAPDKATWAADLPAVPPEILTLIQDDSLTGVLDVGGDKGSVVLAAFSEALLALDSAVWYVINQSRLGAQSPREALGLLREIEARARLPVTGLINNTHLLGETTLKTIMAVAEYTWELSARSGLPLVFNGIQESLAPDLTLPEPILPLALVMKRPWE
ncbi:MAG: hypothetical protein PHP02_03455 [Eubacteriales bacterium]|nr:hypothetical protein [Eubacteriales bacterium]